MAAYEDALVGPLFVPWGEHLLDLVDVQVGDSVLDVACGPGTVAQLAAARVGPLGSVVGCDLSEEMLSIARSKGDVGDVSIEYRQCPAEKLSVEHDSFDVAVCQQGLQFFGNRVGALSEIRRALRGSGRVGVSVWCEIESCEPFAAIASSIARVLGPEAAAGYCNGPWGFNDAQQIHDDLRAAGFGDVEVRRDAIAVAFDDADHLIRTLGAAPVGAQVHALDSDGRRALRSAVEDATADLTKGGVISGLTTCHTAMGTA